MNTVKDKIKKNCLPYINLDFPKCKLLLDSGCTICLLDPKVAYEQIPHNIYTEATDLITPHGHDISNEKVNFPLDSFGMHSTYPFTVYKFHTQYEGIIGFKFLEKYGFTIDLNRKLLIGPQCQMPIHFQNVIPRKHNYPIKLNHLDKSIQNQLIKIFNVTEKALQLPGQPLNFSSKIKHHIRTKDEIPVHAKLYRQPEKHRIEIQDQITDLLQKGIIRPSISPWSFPVVMVRKKPDQSGNEKWRMAIDYRQLNEKTIDDRYPLPQIDNILDKLKGSKFFTTLDLASGFHQIEVHEESIEKTAFTVENGHFEFLRMPFGLKNAPATFQRLMNHILRDHIGKNCYVYMDDIIIYSETVESHLADIHRILEVLKNENMKIQLDKSEFFKNEIEFLGHINSRGNQTQPKQNYSY